jgi:hypothetical protein
VLFYLVDTPMTGLGFGATLPARDEVHRRLVGGRISEGIGASLPHVPRFDGSEDNDVSTKTLDNFSMPLIGGSADGRVASLMA